MYLLSEHGDVDRGDLVHWSRCGLSSIDFRSTMYHHYILYSMGQVIRLLNLCFNDFYFLHILSLCSRPRFFLLLKTALSHVMAVKKYMKGIS